MDLRNKVDKWGLDNDRTFSRWKQTPLHHQSTSLTYTHTAGEKPLERGPDKTLIIRSRCLHSSSVFQCSFSVFSLHPSITPLPVPLFAASTIQLPCQTRTGAEDTSCFSHKILNWTRRRTLEAACIAHQWKAPHGWGVARRHWSNDVNNQLLWLHNEGREAASTSSSASLWVEVFNVTSLKCFFGARATKLGQHFLGDAQ